MAPDHFMEVLTQAQSQWQRGNHNPIQYANTAKHEAKLKLAIIKSETDRIERMTK